jgi:hypothetical protein
MPVVPHRRSSFKEFPNKQSHVAPSSAHHPGHHFPLSSPPLPPPFRATEYVINGMAANRLSSYLFDTGNRCSGDEQNSSAEDETVEPEQGNGKRDIMQLCSCPPSRAVKSFHALRLFRTVSSLPHYLSAPSGSRLEPSNAANLHPGAQVHAGADHKVCANRIWHSLKESQRGADRRGCSALASWPILRCCC